MINAIRYRVRTLGNACLIQIIQDHFSFSISDNLGEIYISYSDNVCVLYRFADFQEIFF